LAKNKLILCVCGAGINTSTNAKNTILDYLEKEGVTDIDVKHLMISEMDPYRDRENMVIVWMTKVDGAFGAPSFKGLPYLIGSRKAKEQLTKDIIGRMNEIYRP
jgi:galactitol-specific phosphotransferase system IIB component